MGRVSITNGRDDCISRDLERLEEAFCDNKSLVAALDMENNEKQPIRNKGGSGEETRKMPERGAMSLNLPSPHNPKETASKKERDAIDHLDFIFRLLTFAAVCIAGWIYWGQWKAAEKQVSEMVKQRQSDQRAWVTAQPKTAYVFTNDATAYVEIQLSNIGKTPAYAVSNVAVIAWPASQCEYILSNHPFLPTKASGMIIPSEVSFLRTGKTYITNIPNCFIYGKVWYTDINRRRHWTEFCYFYTNEAFAVMEGHNTSDDEKNGQ